MLFESNVKGGLAVLFCVCFQLCRQMKRFYGRKFDEYLTADLAKPLLPLSGVDR